VFQFIFAGYYINHFRGLCKKCILKHFYIKAKISHYYVSIHILRQCENLRQYSSKNYVFWHSFSVLFKELYCKPALLAVCFGVKYSENEQLTI